MSIGQFFSNAKEKVSAFSDTLSNSAPVQFLKRAETKFEDGVDALPKPVSVFLHLVPVINIPIHYAKEQALSRRSPEISASIQSNLRYKKLKEKTGTLEAAKKTQTEALESMKEKKAALETSPDDTSEGLIGKKNRLWKKYSLSQVSDNKIAAKEKELEKTEEKLQTAMTDFQTAEAYKTQCEEAFDNNKPEIEATLKERKLFRNIFRVSLAAVAVAAVAFSVLSAFTSVPLAVGLTFAVIFGVGLGAHIALIKKDNFKHDGEESLKPKSE